MWRSAFPEVERAHVHAWRFHVWPYIIITGRHALRFEFFEKVIIFAGHHHVGDEGLCLGQFHFVGVVRKMGRTESENSTLRIAAAVCDNANKALELAKTQSFDLILSDVVMPGKDGLTLLEERKAQGVATPVVMMSGQAHIEMAVRATRLGALDFLEKPIPPKNSS